MAASDPAIALAHWRAQRELLYREHPQSPGPARGPRHVPSPPFRARPEPPLRGDHRAGTAARNRAPSPSSSPTAAPTTRPSRASGASRSRSRAARARCRSSGWPATRAASSSRSATRRTAPRPTARVATSSTPAKSADLGGDPATGTLIIDFNFAFQPSCAFDPRWACPLAPPENRLEIPIRAGERLDQ